MGFNFGAFAGGAAEGITSGSNLADQMQQRRLREAQLNAFNASNLGEQAFTNAMIPGMSAMPQGANAGGQQPLLSRIPFIGDLGAQLGLWGGVPPGQPGMMPPGQPMARPQMAGSPPRMDMAGGQPSPAPGGQPAPSGAPPIAQPPAGIAGATDIGTIASAIDQANPGLRQSNPAAFAAAVQMGMKFMQQQQQTGLDTRFKEAQITGMGSENKLREAQAQNIPVQTDLTRAQIENQRAETSIRGEELKIVPAKLKLQEAEVKLREMQAEAAQAKMRVDEAELNAKTGDYQSQREFRDAQIANMRAERLLKMQKQKTDEMKTGAEIQELGSRSKKQEAEAGYAERRGNTPMDQDKLINQELTKAQVQFRFHQNQINDLMTSMNPNDPKIKARINEHMREAAAYGARVKDLEGQLSTAPKTVDNPFQQTEVPAVRQSELSKVSQKFAEFARSNNVQEAKRLKELMISKGIPAHEVEWAIQNARTLMQQAPAVQVPQSR